LVCCSFLCDSLADILQRYGFVVENALDELLEVERQRSEFEEQELYEADDDGVLLYIVVGHTFLFLLFLFLSLWYSRSFICGLPRSSLTARRQAEDARRRRAEVERQEFLRQQQEIEQRNVSTQFQIQYGFGCGRC
jgi:hypothetical protein